MDGTDGLHIKRCVCGPKRSLRQFFGEEKVDIMKEIQRTRAENSYLKDAGLDSGQRVIPEEKVMVNWELRREYKLDVLLEIGHLPDLYTSIIASGKV